MATEKQIQAAERARAAKAEKENIAMLEEAKKESELQALEEESVVEPYDAVGNVFASPINEIKPAAVEEHKGGWDFDVKKMIEEAVQGVLAERGVQANVGSIPVELTNPPVQAPPSYKKHYRCDSAPMLMIQEMDMSAIERGERPQSNPIVGQYIKFRMGHLYTKDDNQIAQIEWMIASAPMTPDGQDVIGGFPAIYEDDGAQIYHCEAGCGFVTASWNSYKSHMKATHSIVVSK